MLALPPVVTVATVIEPTERARVDAAAHGRFDALHTESIIEVIRAVRERPVQAVLVSPRCVSREQMPAVTSLVAGFPGVRTVAVTTRYDAGAGQRLLDFGAVGVQTFLDLGEREGWRELRDLIAHPASSVGAVILDRLIPAMGRGACFSSRRFFEELIQLAPGLATVRTLAERFHVRSSTFMSRFLRARLPSPKRYLVSARLLYAAGLLDAPGMSIADVAYRLDYSSPQSFGRHLRGVMGLTAVEFRQRYPFDVALSDFLARLIIPFRKSFCSFNPLERGVDLGHCRNAGGDGRR
jgi:AraC-like DNA-binding protein